MTALDFDTAARLVAEATSPDALFGPPPEPGTPPARHAKERFRQLAWNLHPDRAPDSRRTEADHAFTSLNELWQRHQRDDKHAMVFTANGRTYKVGAQLASGDLANLYRLTSPDGSDSGTVLKLARSSDDNDLIRAEADALNAMKERGDKHFSAYVPRLRGTLRHRDPVTGIERQGNLLPRLTGFHTLAAVERAYPGGLDPRDAAWMWRRLLVGLGYAHKSGVIHGAVLPDHVMIHPEDHGLMIVDWCYQPGLNRRIPAMVARYQDWYPPEVAARLPADPSTDIFLATRCMTHLIKDAIPQEMRQFARGCTLKKRASRPRDAWQLLSEFDDLLARLYGPRKFRPFHMPTDPTPHK